MSDRSTRKASRNPGIPDAVLSYLYSGLPFLLRRADQRAVALFNDGARPLGTTLVQCHLLYAIAKMGPMPQVELSRIVAADSSTVSMVVGTLEERGWVHRTLDPADRRRKRLGVTSAGEEQLERIEPIFRSTLTEFQLPLGTRVDTFTALLSTIVRASDGVATAPAAATPASLRAFALIRGSSHFLIRRCLQLIEIAASARVGAETLTLRQYALLLVIALDEGIGEAAIARTLGYELSNVTFIVRLLVSKGLATVQPGGRRRSYRATDAGRALLRTAERPLTDALEDLLRPLTLSQRRDLQGLLGRLIRGGGEGGPPAFARITARSDWPADPRIDAYGIALDARHIADPLDDPLLDLIVRAGEAAQSAGSVLLGQLGPSEQLALRRLLARMLADGSPKRATRSRRSKKTNMPARIENAAANHQGEVK